MSTDGCPVKTSSSSIDKTTLLVTSSTAHLQWALNTNLIQEATEESSGLDKNVFLCSQLFYEILDNGTFGSFDAELLFFTTVVKSFW